MCGNVCVLMSVYQTGFLSENYCAIFFFSVLGHHHPGNFSLQIGQNYLINVFKIPSVDAARTLRVPQMVKEFQNRDDRRFVGKSGDFVEP